MDSEKPNKSKAPLDEFNRAAARLARKAADLPEYDMDDPERPFTLEYDDLVVDTESDDESDADTSIARDLADQDDSPSDDARALYKQPSPAELDEIRRRRSLGQVKGLRQVLESTQQGDSKDRKQVS